jgi:pyruvate dehydrogenase E1 component alpha subunit
MSDPQKYRTKEEVEQWKNRDPLEMVRDRILVNGIASEADLDTIDTKIKAVVEASVKFAEDSPYPEPEAAFEDVYVDTEYPFLRE